MLLASQIWPGGWNWMQSRVTGPTLKAGTLGTPLGGTGACLWQAPEGVSH